MIKRSLFFIIAGWLSVTSAYCNTEIKPPEGPFISSLRTTFSVKKSVSVDIRKASKKEKVYNFRVPDLGRYQERVPATVPYQPEPIRAPIFSSFDNTEFDSSTINDMAPLDVPVNGVDELTDSPYKLIPNDQISSEKLNRPKSFDSLPIEYKQSEQENSYPSEWAPSFSNHQLQRNNSYNMTSPRQNQRFLPNNSNQFSPTMGMPFPNQMPLWPLGNSHNSNSGYN